jgi:hypothetical protein
MKFGLGSSTEKNGIPRIESVKPAAAIPGGEVEIRGHGFATRTQLRPVVRFGEAEASLALASPQRLVAKVPEGANGGVVRVATPEHESAPFPVALGMQIADNLHPVASPAVDTDGNIYVTFSGQRGHRVPVSLYKITANFNVKPFVPSLMNPSGLALDKFGNLFVSCRNDGTIHKVSPDGRSEQWIEGMGIATGLAFDRNENLYVGDRSGTIFKISPSREVFVFATLEPSVAAYHLAMHPSGELYATGPTTSSFDRVYRISQGGDVTTFSVDWVARRGWHSTRWKFVYCGILWREARNRAGIAACKAELALSGSGVVGMALLPSGRAIIATSGEVFTLDWEVRGLPLAG